MVKEKDTDEDAACSGSPNPELCSDRRLSQVGRHGEVCYRSYCEDGYGKIMERSCSACLLSVKGPVKNVPGQTGNRPTTFDQAKAMKVEQPIITVTTHSQSDPPTVSRRSAKDGLT